MPQKLSRKEQLKITSSLHHAALSKMQKYLARGWQANEPLLGANCLCYVRNPKLAQRLIEIGANPNDAFSGTPPLLAHVGTRNLEMVRFLVQAGADVNVRYSKRKDPDTPYGTTALMEAVNHNQWQMFKLLIKAGADLNSKDEHAHTALWHATFWTINRAEMIKELVRRGAKMPDDVLAGPVWEGDETIVRLLIKKGANVNPEIRRWGRKFENGDTLLSCAIRKVGFFNYPVSIALMLINAGADVNRMSFSRPPINLAAHKGLVQIVKALIRNGAQLESTDVRGRTALGEVALTGDSAVLKILIKAGANLNHRDKDLKTPVRLAWEMGHLDIVEFLQKAGASVRPEDISGKTALEELIPPGDKFSVEFAIRYGANVNSRGSSGQTPLQLAREHGHREIVDLLKKFGAKT